MQSIRPLELDDIPALRDLFATYPHKAHQQRFQGLDADALADFFLRGERARLEGGAAKSGALQFVGLGEGDVRAFAVLHSDEWHSRFYPYRFGRIAPFLTHLASPALRAELLEVLLDAARNAGYQHLIARIDGAEFYALHALEQAGFRLVDTSVKMAAPLGNRADETPPSRATSMRVRRFEKADLAEVARIAARSHGHNHYYNDPLLDSAASDQLFEAWVERCCLSLAQDIFILEHRDEVAGFVIYLDPKALNAEMGTRLLILDFVCLEQRARGGGVGQWFIAETWRRLAGRYGMVELRTSHYNYPALACYQSLGMRIISTDFVLHRHEPKAREALR